MTPEIPEVPDGTWLWLQGFTRWIGTGCFFVGYRLRVRVTATIDMRNRLVALIAELDQIRGLGVLRTMRPKGA